MMTPREDDEGLFSRDINGQLVRLDPATEADYQKRVKLQIDGSQVEVSLAEPLKDSQGNVVLDAQGRTTPRYTTIYDAALKLTGAATAEWIPTLCHQPHMRPVAVCRTCMVQIYGMKRGKRTAERKLFPACQHPVRDGMEVFTHKAQNADGERVRRAVAVVTELLAADNLRPVLQPAPQEIGEYNELKKMTDRFAGTKPRFTGDAFIQAVPSDNAPGRYQESKDNWPNDRSSPVFQVDHEACILCDRCSRACNEVKSNHVIGRTGKGALTTIGFDLDNPMGRSSCVQCGECMVSCPTTAITFKPVGTVEIVRKDPQKASVIKADELMNDSLFEQVPPKFLLWQQNLVVRRKVAPGEFVCRQGEPGNTAFIIKEGTLRVLPERKSDPPRGLFQKLTVRGKQVESDDLTRGLPRTPKEVVVGEMSCLSGRPRNRDIRAETVVEVWEVRRNVLDRIMRSPVQRPTFERIYRDRALTETLLQLDFFRNVPEQEYNGCVEHLSKNITFVGVNPGVKIFEQGDPASDCYLIRIGHVRVGIQQFGREVMVLYRRPGTFIGELGLLPITMQDAKTSSVEEIDANLVRQLQSGNPVTLGVRSATCTSLDHVELARVSRDAFIEMILRYPTIRRRIVEISVKRLLETASAATNLVESAALREYLDQGLYQGQSILALDLDKCTRCDECVQACVQQHGDETHGVPLTRLLREGFHFGHFLVARSCRSCIDPYCMIGCPVDSIHRGKHQQIVIEDHCIGCGLCAKNCPYDNIFMIGNEHRQIEMPDPENSQGSIRVAQPKAATCDLCDTDGTRDKPKPRCVYACPHDAAFRFTGEQLLQQVVGGRR
jgi:Fe-S-cluster-containing dehydrogenase component